MHIAHGRTKKHKFTVQSGTKSGTRFSAEECDRGSTGLGPAISAVIEASIRSDRVRFGEN